MPCIFQTWQGENPSSPRPRLAVTTARGVTKTTHESHRESSVEFRCPGPSAWRHAQDWAQRAVDRPEGAPLPAYEPEYDREPPSDHLSFAFGPFIDVYPNPRGGWHMGFMLGFNGQSVRDTANDNKLFMLYGGAASFWAGYEAWVSGDWSMGGMLKAQAFYRAAMSNLFLSKDFHKYSGEGSFAGTFFA